MSFGAGMLVPLQGAAQGAAVRVVCALWSWHTGGAAGYFCRVLLQGAALRVLCAAATGYCCQSAVCAMKLGCWCRCRGWLRDVYGSVGVGPDGDYVYMP